MGRLIAWILVALFATVGCDGARSGEGGPVAKRVAKVAVSADGRVELDGNVVSLEELRAAFAELSRAEGVVWYYREAADAEPHPLAMEVVQAIIDARLPVSMSTKPDFSDVVLPDGSSQAR